MVGLMAQLRHELKRGLNDCSRHCLIGSRTSRNPHNRRPCTAPFPPLCRAGYARLDSDNPTGRTGRQSRSQLQRSAGSDSDGG